MAELVGIADAKAYVGFNATTDDADLMDAAHLAGNQLVIDYLEWDPVLATTTELVDGHGAPANTYPLNPNGSPGGLTAVTTTDGRFTAMMPHPERVQRNIQMSWTSGDPGGESPWLRMFRNARVHVG